MVILVNQDDIFMIVLSSTIIIKEERKKIYIYKIQHLFIYHIVNIRLFSRLDMENA